MPKMKLQLSKPRTMTAAIKRGGASSAPVAARESRAQVVTYWPPDLLARVDALVAEREPRIPRLQWIMEAVYDKLAREENHA